jgi:hypothetical protein
MHRAATLPTATVRARSPHERSGPSAHPQDPSVLRLLGAARAARLPADALGAKPPRTTRAAACRASTRTTRRRARRGHTAGCSPRGHRRVRRLGRPPATAGSDPKPQDAPRRELRRDGAQPVRKLRRRLRGDDSGAAPTRRTPEGPSSRRARPRRVRQHHRWMADLGPARVRRWRAPRCDACVRHPSIAHSEQSDVPRVPLDGSERTNRSAHAIEYRVSRAR